MIQSVPAVNLSNDLTRIALAMQAERTGHAPKAVTVVASDNTIVFTYQEALTPAEKILAQTESGAAKVEQYHRALFAVSCSELRKENWPAHRPEGSGSGGGLGACDGCARSDVCKWHNRAHF